MRIYLDSIGCRLNQSEIEKMGLQFRAAGHTLVENPASADLVVVNTCTVTGEAAADSRQKIRQAWRAGSTQIVVTGCWSTLEPEHALALPGVARVIANQGKDHLVSKVLNLNEEEFDREPLVRKPLPGLHLRTRAFIKSQDGCDNHCTYCVTRIARGPGHSQPVGEILGDVRAALAGGVQEIVLTGVNLGSWGHDLEPHSTLRDLVEILLSQTGPARLRFSSLEPWNLDEEFFSLWKNPRLCRHLHLPLQSGSAATLRRMARKTTPESFARLVAQARKAVPQIAITTDILVGFPGESEAEFAESLDFIRQMQFSGGHVFAYSPRPGTPAACYAEQVPFAIRKQRSAIVRQVLAESAGVYARRFLGQTLPVLWEATDALGPGGWQLQGFTDNYLRVRATHPQRLWNQITPVKLEALQEEGIQGQILTPVA